MPHVHRLVFDSLILYFSYQHAIAFYSHERFVVRNDFWGRRRKGRLRHINAILLDMKMQLGRQLETAEGSDTFASDLAEEMGAYVMPKMSTATKKQRDTNKRRVML